MSAHILGRAARSIRAEWEHETWSRRERLYNVAVSNLLIAIALDDLDASDATRAAAAQVAAAHLERPAP